MSELEHRELWEEYLGAPDADGAIGALVDAWMPLVYSVLKRITIRLPSHVQVEDLLQSAIIGLCSAIERFDIERGIRFSAFACPRIRGAVLDELRRNDHMPRSARTQLKQVQESIQQWSSQHGRTPDVTELDEIAGTESGEVASLLDRAHPWLSLDQEVAIGNDGQAMQLRDTIADPQSTRPDNDAEKEDIHRNFRVAFRDLSAREQKILHLYYFEELNLKEIGALYAVSEARVCQIHALAMVKLRSSMQKYD